MICFISKKKKKTPKKSVLQCYSGKPFSLVSLIYHLHITEFIPVAFFAETRNIIPIITRLLYINVSYHVTHTSPFAVVLQFPGRTKILRDCHLIVVEPAEKDFLIYISSSWIICTVGKITAKKEGNLNYSLER